MARASDVAKFLLYLSSRESKNHNLSNLKLQKLLYYSQGASIARRDQLLFNETLEAWPYGPVVEEVYNQYNSNGSLPIEVDFSDEDVRNITSQLTREEAEVIFAAWEVHKHDSAWTLVESSHNELPWKYAWKNGIREIDPTHLFEQFRDGSN